MILPGRTAHILSPQESMAADGEKLRRYNMKTTAKRFAGWLLVLAMLLTLLPQAVIAEDPGGAADLTITTLEDLEAFRAEVDSGNTFEGQLVELTADIDLSAVCGEIIGSWNLIGDSTNKFPRHF